jgi:hypothetical protein
MQRSQSAAGVGSGENTPMGSQSGKLGSMRRGEKPGEENPIGTGSRVMSRLRAQVASQKDRGRDETIGYLDKSLAQEQQDRFYQRQAKEREEAEQKEKMSAEVVRLNRQLANPSEGGFVTPGQTLTQAALQIGYQGDAKASENTK